MCVVPNKDIFAEILAEMELSVDCGTVTIQTPVSRIVVDDIHSPVIVARHELIPYVVGGTRVLLNRVGENSGSGKEGAREVCPPLDVLFGSLLDLLGSGRTDAGDDSQLSSSDRK